MRVEPFAVLICHNRQLRLLADRLHASLLLPNLAAVAFQIVEEMMHHLVLLLRPHRHLMRANIAKLLKRCENLRNELQADDHAAIVGDVR